VQKYNRVFNVIAVFIFVGFFWAITLFLTFSFTEKRDSLKELLPNDVEVVLSVDTDQLIKKLLFDALYKTEFEDNDLLLLNKGKDSDQAKTNGIALNNEMVIFYTLWNKIPIQGFLFNVSNKKAFDKFELEGKQNIKKSNGTQGIILMLKDNASEDLREYASTFSDDVINKKYKKANAKENLEMLSLKYKGNEHTYIQDLHLNAKIEDERILINGSGKKNKELTFSLEQYSKFSQPANDKYLELQFGQLPDSLYKYFKIIFDEIDIKVPEVTSQQMLIYGSSIENIRGSTTLLPKVDWIIRFDSIVSIDEQLGAINESSNRIFFMDKRSIEIGGTKYFYQQISDFEIYIGVTESPKFQPVKTQILPSIKGNPSVLLDIEGKGFIAQFVNVMPIVKNTKYFMGNIEYFDIHTIEENNEDLKINGEIRLKKGKMMTVELVKYLLMFMK